MNYIDPDEYEPIRSSVKNQQTKLMGVIDDLQKRLAKAEAKSATGADYAFQSVAYSLRKKLADANEQLKKFNNRQRELDAYRNSTAAKEAGLRVVQFAAAFEKALLQAVSAAAELTTQAAEFAAILRVSDPGLWPSKGAVNDAIRSRVINLFGDHSTVKLAGYGSAGGKAATSLIDQFKPNQ